MADQLEGPVIQQRLNIGTGACVEIVGAEDFVPLSEQPFAQMRTDEAGAAGDKYSFLEMHG
jgi:hypothetical protein